MKKKDAIPQKSILFNLLQSFNKQELNHFQQFIANKYFNTDKRILILFETLKTELSEGNTFGKEFYSRIYVQVFGLKSSNKLLNQQQQKLLSARMSDLTKLAKRFLVIEALNNKKACEIELLQAKLVEKKLFSLARKESKKTKKKLASISAKKVSDLAAILQNEIGEMNTLYKSGLLLKEDNLEEVDRALDLYYLINKLKLYITSSSLKNVTKKAYDFASLSPILPLLNLPQYAKKPIIKIYLTLIELIETNQETTFYNLLQLLDQHPTYIPEEDLKDAYNVAINFCVYQVRTGNIKYSKSIFKLYKKMDYKNILLEEESMRVMKLKNIVTASCHADEFDWAINTVKKYYSYTAKTFQKSVYHFNMGVIYFYKKNYKKSISALIRVNKINLVYDIDCRMFLLKAHFQLDTTYDERSMQIFRSAERFITNHQILPTTHKKSYKNFIKVLINLYRIKHRIGKKTIVNIYNQLVATDFITDKKWLLEKIKELEFS